MCLIHRVFTITPVVTANLLLLAGHHPSAYGQASNNAVEPQMQEVTVTVQRREQNILDVPYNITAVTGDDVAASFTRDSAELLRSILVLVKSIKGLVTLRSSAVFASAD